MAGSSLLLLLDDIAAVLDDVAAMTKVAAGKTAGVLGDDLAVNAEKAHRGAGRPRASRRLGGGQGLAAQQGHPGAGGPGAVSAGRLGHYPGPDAGRPVPLLRGF